MGGDGVRKVVLVVDDEVALADALCFDVEDAGYEALKAHSGNDAIALLKTRKVDLIISDVRMPNGSGLELLAEVKKGNSDEPVVLLISGFSDVKPEDAYALGAEGVFAKPFEIDLLLRQIERCLLPKERRWERVNVQGGDGTSVSLRLQGFEAARQAALLNLGRGGMCLELGELAPVVGSRIEFTVTFSDDRFSPMSGTGEIRWRKVDLDGKRCQVGFEFLSLTGESLPIILSMIESLMPKAYIPKV